VLEDDLLTLQRSLADQALAELEDVADALAVPVRVAGE